MRNINPQTRGTEKICNDKRGGRTTGRVVDIPNNITQFIENEFKGRIVTTHPDGHCVRRAIRKIWNLHPGQVIKYMGEKCKKLMEQNIMNEWENEVE